MPDIERAVVITFNWETEQTLHTMFEGDGAALQAERFLIGERERNDFSPPDWVWVQVRNPVASEVFQKGIMGMFDPQVEERTEIIIEDALEKAKKVEE